MAFPQCSCSVQRWLGFACSCLVLLFGGTYFLIGILAEDIKLQFRLSQQEVEFIVGVGVCCANIGYPWGLALEYMSERTGFLISMLMGSVPAMLLYSADYAVDFYADYWWLLAVYWGVVCTSFVIGYLLSTAVTLGNFPDSRKGCVMSVMNCAWWFGDGLFNYFYTLTETGKLPTVGTIFLILAISSGVVKGLASVFVHPVPLNGTDETSALIEKEEKGTIPGTELSYGDTSCTISGVDQNGKGDSWVDTLGLRLFLELDFHCVLWGFVIGVSSGVMYLGNVSIIAATLGFNDFYEAVLIGAPFAGLAIMLACGFLSDRTRLFFPRAMYAAIGALLSAFMFAISAVYGLSEGVFIVTIILLFGSNGIFYTIIGATISERFGMRHFKRNWGLVLMCSAAMSLVTTAIFGLLYENAIDGGKDVTKCKGLNCLQGIFIFGSTLSFLSAAWYLLLARRYIVGLFKRTV